jgi:hypothetical protein
MGDICVLPRSPQETEITLDICRLDYRRSSNDRGSCKYLQVHGKECGRNQHRNVYRQKRLLYYWSCNYAQGCK